MRLRSLRAVLCVLLMMGFCDVAFPADSASARKVIEQRFRQMDRAARRLDLKGYTAFSAPDIVAIDDGETFTGSEQFTKHLSEDFEATKKMYTFSSKIDQFSETDDLAKVDFTTHLVCDSSDPAGKYGTKGALHRFDLQMKFHNEWKQVSGKWLLTRFVSNGASGMIDGKPIPTPSQK